MRHHQQQRMAKRQILGRGFAAGACARQKPETADGRKDTESARR